MKRVVKLNENDLNVIVKRVISESQSNDIIEDLLKDRFPEIVSVSFREKRVILANVGLKNMTVTEINVICDMDGYLGDPIQKSYRSYKSNIFKFLESVVGLDLSSYGSFYELLVYNLEPKLI